MMMQRSRRLALALVLTALMALAAATVHGQAATPEATPAAPTSPESKPGQTATLEGQATQAVTASGSVAIKLTEVGKGFSRPTFVTGAGDGSGRLFVVEQTGKIRIIQDGKVLPTPFLDVTSLIHREALQGGYSERGLLGLAFDPKFTENAAFTLITLRSTARLSSRATK